MTPDQFFKAFHHHGSESDWPVVVEAGDVRFLGQGNKLWRTSGRVGQWTERETG